MRSLLVGGFLTVLAAVAVHWIITRPTLDNLPPRYRFLDFLHHSAFKLSEFVSLMGIGNKYTNYRAVSELFYKIKPSPKLKQNISVNITKIEGAPVKIYSPPSSTDNLLPGVIYFHGGGFTVGSPELVEPLCLILADRLDAIIISVDYKLAPEYPFPHPFNDCYQAVLHVINNAESYGIEQRQIALAGDSAGGNLAAAVTQSIMSLVKKCRREPIAGQVLINPSLQFFDFNLPSSQQNKDMYILTQADVAEYWSVYMVGNTSLVDIFLHGNHSFHLRNGVYAKYLGLTNEDDHKIIAAKKKAEETIPKHVLEAITNPHASPLMAPMEDIKWLPSTFVLTAEYDVLSDEGRFYASRLRAGEVDVKHEHYPSVHDFILFHLIPEPTGVAAKALDDIVEFLGEVFSVGATLDDIG